MFCSWNQVQPSLNSFVFCSLLDDDAQDKEFEAKLKAQKKSIDDAIALDKKKSEAESAEAKAKADKIKKEADEKAQKAAKEKAEKEEAESKSKLEQSSSTSLKGLEEYQKHFEKIEHFRKNIRPKLQDPALSKLCFMVQKTINRSTGQLQSDRQTIMVKVSSLGSLIIINDYNFTLLIPV